MHRMRLFYKFQLPGVFSIPLKFDYGSKIKNLLIASYIAYFDAINNLTSVHFKYSFIESD